MVSKYKYLNMGNIPLHTAAENGNKQELMRLLESGACTNIKNSYFDTPLHLAVKNNHKEVVRLLLENGADIEAKNLHGLSSLHLANSVDVAELLLQKGANIENKNNFGNTPLFTAAIHDRKDLVALLLEKGANIEAKNNYGFTPLGSIVKYGCKKVVCLLLEKGADVNSNNAGLSPLNLAASDVECGKILIKYALLRNPETKSVKEIVENAVLSAFWDDCQNQINKLLGSSSLPLYRFLQETNEDRLVAYLSNETTGLRAELQNLQNFKMYTNMVAGQIRKAIKRECLLQKVNIIMEQCGLKILPTEIKFKIAALLTTSELEICTKTTSNLLKREFNYLDYEHPKTSKKKVKS